jgi:hypothetical protein
MGHPQRWSFVSSFRSQFLRFGVYVEVQSGLKKVGIFDVLQQFSVVGFYLCKIIFIK